MNMKSVNKSVISYSVIPNKKMSERNLNFLFQNVMQISNLKVKSKANKFKTHFINQEMYMNQKY